MLLDGKSEMFFAIFRPQPRVIQSPRQQQQQPQDSGGGGGGGEDGRRDPFDDPNRYRSKLSNVYLGNGYNFIYAFLQVPSAARSQRRGSVCEREAL